LGYYSRARNLHRGAKMIADQGKFPKTRAGWLEIPGVGEYTAGAILSIAGNQPEPILDANVERVLSRIKRVSRAKGDTEFKTRLWKISRSFVEKGYKHQMNPSQLNQALMELGALICTPTKPRCLLCPLVDLCEASKKGDTDAFPPKKPPKEWLKVKENMHCVIFEAQWVLLRQRVKGEWRAGLWDLLEKNPGEFISNLNRVGQVETRHTVTRHKIDRKTDIWQVASKKHEIGEYRWVSVRAPEVPVGSALKKTLKAVEQVLMDRK